MATGSEATMDTSSSEGILDVEIHSFDAPTLPFYLEVFFSFLALNRPEGGHPPVFTRYIYLVRYRLDPLSSTRHEAVSAVAGDAGHGRRG